MSGLTDDPTDPRLTHGADAAPVPQAEVYLVLSDGERAKGFVRPLRHSYRHVGIPGPTYPLRDLTPEEERRHLLTGYVKYETYPPEHAVAVVGRFWTQEQLDAIDKGCGAVTTMNEAIAETYARQPHFYGSTYCVGCGMHRPVGEHGEFVWAGTHERVGS